GLRSAHRDHAAERFPGGKDRISRSSRSVSVIQDRLPLALSGATLSSLDCNRVRKFRKIESNCRVHALPRSGAAGVWPVWWTGDDAGASGVGDQSKTPFGERRMRLLPTLALAAFSLMS